MLSGGWWLSSGTARVDDAMPGVVLSVLAVIAVVGGALAWVAAGRRRVRQRREELVGAIEGITTIAPSGAGTGAITLVALKGSTRYHRDDCLLVRGKEVEQVASGLRSVRRRTPCEMCQP
jgi:hypothetical protein